MLNKQYIKRKITDKIMDYLDTEDIIVLHGARQVGKTSIIKWIEDHLKKEKKAVYYLDLEFSSLLHTLNFGPEGLINLLKEEGFEIDGGQKIFILIDEIQYLENPSSFLKLIADHYKNIKLIVSGSSSFEIKSKFKDSLVGRTVNFEIFNLDFEEFLLFKKYHFEKLKIFTDKKKTELALLFKEYVLYGGYPKIVLTDDLNKKEKYLLQIIDTYVKKDIRDLADIREIEKFNKLLEVLASQSGNLVNMRELSGLTGLAVQTIEKYLFIMENTYILKLVKPYSKNIRNELFRQPKIFFYDSGLAQMLWLRQFQKEIIGNVFETAIFAELAKQFGQSEIYFWRTKDKKEIDFIVRIKNKILPIEVKLNFNKFKAASINYFNEKYKLTDYRVIGLEGDKPGDMFVYPWEL